MEEELTLEKLLTDMRGTIDSIQKLIDEKDIEGARQVFTQIQELIANETQIDLDVIDETVPPEEGQSYDHVLHQLLSNISGIIEVSHEEQVTEDVIEIKKKELLKARAELKEAEKENDDEKKTELEGKISDLEKEIEELEADLEELKRIEEELKEVNEQIDEIFVNGGEVEETEEVEPIDLEEFAKRKEDNRKRIASLEKDQRQIEEEMQKEKDPRILSQLDQDLKKVNNELEVAYKDRDEIETDEEKLNEEQEASELKEKLLQNAEKIKRLTIAQKFQKEEIGILEKQGNTNSSYYNDKQQNLKNISEELKQARKEREELEKIVSKEDIKEYDIIARRNIWGEELKGLQDGLEYLQQELNDAEKNIQKIEERIEALKEQANDPSISEEQKKQIEEQIEQEEEKLSNENAVIAKTTADIKLQNVEIKKANTNFKRAETDLNKFQQQKEENAEKEPSKLEQLQQRRAELEKRKEELEDKLRTTTTKTVVTDRLDMGAEARRVGDNIFKTSEIRKELSDRNVSREDFIAFYQQGIESTRENITKANDEAKEIRKEVSEIFVDRDSDQDLFSQAEEAYSSENREEAITIYEQIRQNMIKNGKHNNILQASGFDKQEITDANLDKMAEFVGTFIESSNNRLNELVAFMKDQKENMSIFEKEIQIIQDEQKAIDMLKDAPEEIQEKADKEKELRARQIKASMYGNDPELQEEWDERFNRFYENKVTAEKEFSYTDKDGNVKKVKYETIKDYDEYKDDAFFLNLEEYKKNLELTTRFRASGDDPYSLTPELIEAYEAAEQQQEGAGKLLIEATVKNMEEYVTSFHGNVNEHAIKYSTYKTAGSALKAMKPVKGVSPASVKYASAVENVGRFFGIRPPKFTRVNENGEEVRDIKGGLLTLATDALVVGVAGAAVAAGPLALATWGAAYAAKGIVIGGYQLAARREMRKYGDEIRNNLPTPYKTSRDAKEVARKDYYRTHDRDGNRLEDGKTNGKLSTWFKAKTDKYIFRGRKARTEEAIIEERITQSNDIIDKRTDTALDAIFDNADKADRNQQTRVENTRQEIRSGAATNDIFADPEAAKKKQEELLAQSARNQALESRGKNRENINPDGAENRRDKFRKDITLKQTEEMDEVVTEGGSIASTAVTEGQKRLGEQHRVDRNRVIYTAILTGAFKFGIDYAAKGFETVQHEDAVYRTEKKAVYRKEDVTENVTKTSVDPNKTVGELSTNGGGLRNTYGASGTGASATTGNVDSVAVRVGNVEVSITEQGVFTKAGTHVHAAVSEGTELSDMTMDQLVETLQATDPSNFAKYLEATGLQNATTSEISKYMIENGHLYLQSGSQGWNLVDSSNIVEKVEQVVTGSKDVFDHWDVKKVLVSDAVDKTTIDPTKIVGAVATGVVAGTAASATDKIHEAAHETDYVEKGTHEQKTKAPKVEKMIKDAQEEANKRRKKEEKENQEEQEEQEEQENQEEYDDDEPEI